MVQLNEDEKVLWSGTPLKMPFLFGVYIGAPIGFSLFTGLIYVAVALQPSAFFFAAIILGLLVYSLHLKYRDWKTTQYTVTNQRVFFDTMIGYDVVRAEDIREVYIKTGLLDRYYGTSRVFVAYRDFQKTTEYWKPHGKIIVEHDYPFFLCSIKDAREVKDLIEQVAAQKQLELKNQVLLNSNKPSPNK